MANLNPFKFARAPTQSSSAVGTPMRLLAIERMHPSNAIMIMIADGQCCFDQGGYHSKSHGAVTVPACQWTVLSRGATDWVNGP